MSQKTASYPHIAARVFDVPLLIEQSKLVTILEFLGPRLGFDVRPKAMEDEEAPNYQPPESHLNGLLQTSTTFEIRSAGHYVGNGVAVLPIIGTLVQRSDWMSDMSGMLSYDRVERMFASAMDDSEVKELVMEIDSPGGEVAGAFDLADRMTDYRGRKKVTAVASEFAASAAYLIASTADEVVVPRTGMVGSIGVVAAHLDYSKAMEKRGVAVTFVYAGDKKVEGNPYEPLSPAAKADWQEEIDGIYQMFVQAVARNRGITAEQVISTQAALLSREKATTAGLATRVNTFSNELSNAVLRSRNPGYSGVFFGSTTRKEQDMGNTVAEKEAAARAEAEAKAKAEADAKVKKDAEEKAAADAKVQAEAQAKKDAEVKAKAEEQTAKGRIKAILESDEAKGREALASHLALETETSVAEAKAILSKTPKGNRLDNAMGRESPGVSSQETSPAAPAVNLDPSAIYARRAEQYSKARPK